MKVFISKFFSWYNNIVIGLILIDFIWLSTRYGITMPGIGLALLFLISVFIAIAVHTSVRIKLANIYQHANKAQRFFMAIFYVFLWLCLLSLSIILMMLFGPGSAEDGLSFAEVLILTGVDIFIFFTS
jgi:hypothetical protein